jgi:multiple antibiotic resistance protein
MAFSPLEVAKATMLIVAALFPIVNPLGGAPIFLSLVDRHPPAVQKALARRIAANSFILLLASMFIGSHVLAFFGLSLPAVQVGGGLLVAATGWGLLNRPDRQREDGDGPRRSDIAAHSFYPFTLPLTVGPGSISVAITLGANMPKRMDTGTLLAPEPLAALSAGALAMALLIWASYSGAERMSRAIGPTGMSVVMRLSSFILLCIGVQITWNGLAAMSGWHR